MIEQVKAMLAYSGLDTVIIRNILRALARIILHQHMRLGQQLAEDHYSEADRKL